MDNCTNLRFIKSFRISTVMIFFIVVFEFHMPVAHYNDNDDRLSLLLQSKPTRWSAFPAFDHCVMSLFRLETGEKILPPHPACACLFDE